MRRTIFTTATLLLGVTTLFAPAAEACISCQYTPEVVQGHSTSHEARTYERTRVVLPKVLSARPAKALAAKSALTLKKVETAKKSDTSTSVATATKPETESKTTSTAASADAKAKPSEETKVAQDVGCKKFIPAVGATVTVPCE